MTTFTPNQFAKSMQRTCTSNSGINTMSVVLKMGKIHQVKPSEISMFNATRVVLPNFYCYSCYSKTRTVVAK